MPSKYGFISHGKAYTLDRWCGKLNHLSMAYILGNYWTRNYYCQNYQQRLCSVLFLQDGVHVFHPRCYRNIEFFSLMRFFPRAFSIVDYNFWYGLLRILYLFLLGMFVTKNVDNVRVIQTSCARFTSLYRCNRLMPHRFTHKLFVIKTEKKLMKFTLYFSEL